MTGFDFKKRLNIVVGDKSREQTLYEMKMYERFMTPKSNITDCMKDFIKLMKNPSFMKSCALKLAKIHELSEGIVYKLGEMLKDINIRLFMEFRDKKINFRQLEHKLELKKKNNRKDSIDEIMEYVQENIELDSNRRIIYE